MGSSASKPARSAAQAATRRQYPKQPSPSTASPASRPQPQRAQPQPQPPRPSPVSRKPKAPAQAPPQTPTQGPVYHSKEKASTEKSSGTPYPNSHPKHPYPATFTNTHTSLCPLLSIHPRILYSKHNTNNQNLIAIDLDGRDPHFAASLRSLGPVTPSPTLSNSSTFNQPQSQSTNYPTVFPPASNPALLALNSRQRITREAERESEDMGRANFPGRRYLDALTIRQAIVMRDKQGLGDGEVERTLRVRKGVLGGLGKGVVGVP
ncbi:hypothetical protein BJY04DRAFT_214338 [Aspergillus karnatakaensis]|uniref:uncharacterized protein n=1 Tax=Aspergillus karnatakaensis TaxID=1810916 RepID=UPI003CCE4513